MDSKSEYTLKQGQQDHADDDQLADMEISDALATDQDELSSNYWKNPSTIEAIFSIGLATIASDWGFSPAAAILTYINEDIGPSANSSLFSIIWSTCSSIAILLFGRISDKFGSRYIVLGASCMGFIGGIIACTAQNMNTLIGANVLLGLSGGVHTCYGLLCGELVPNKYKFAAVALCVFPAVLPTGFGAYLALSLVHYVTWRYVYYIYLILMGITIVCQAIFCFPPSFEQLHTKGWSKMDEFKRIDFGGIFLLVAGLFLFLLGVSWGGEPVPWNSAKILGLLISGFFTLVVFVFWEIYSGVPNPIVPMYLFKDVREFVCCTVVACVAGVLYVSRVKYTFLELYSDLSVTSNGNYLP